MKKKMYDKKLVTHDNDVKTTWYDTTRHDADKMHTMTQSHDDFKKKK
jgi:hypothetical protein